MFMPKGFNIDANGLQVEVCYGGATGDFISLTDIAKYRTAENPGLLSRTGCGRGTPSVSWACGSISTTPSSITSNSRQLNVRQA